jgi:hypothetical protein
MFTALTRAKQKAYIYIYKNCLLRGSRDSAVGIPTGYGLDVRAVGVRIPVGSGFFSISTSSRPTLGFTQPPI